MHDVLTDLLLVALRMTFGGAPNPSQWSDVSDVITDLANDLVRRSDWDPEVFHSPHQHLLDSDEAVDNDKKTVDTAEALGKGRFLRHQLPEDDAVYHISTATWTTSSGHSIRATPQRAQPPSR